MAHIPLPPGIPGILGPMAQYPDAAQPLNAIAEQLLRRESPTFSMADREAVASYVSFLNGCVFCSESHAAVADVYFREPGMAKRIWEDPDSAPISNRLKALLKIAGTVQSAPKLVSTRDVEAAKAQGASDADIHDTVLIAAAFCMFNRYVDGLNTLTPPRDHQSYTEIGQRLATVGYMDPK